MKQHAAADVIGRSKCGCGSSGSNRRAAEAGSEARNGSVEERPNSLRRISAALQLSKEVNHLRPAIRVVGTEGKDPVYHAVDNACKEDRRVAGMRRDIKVVIRRFFVQGRMDPAVPNGDGQIHEIDLIGEAADNPGQLKRPVIEGVLEGWPSNIDRRVVRRGPDAKDIINEPPVEEELPVESRKEAIFVEGVV